MSYQGAGALASTGTDVYWCDGFRESISKVPVGGGAPTLLAGEQHQCIWIAVDATNVYWAREGSAGPELVERPQ